MGLRSSPMSGLPDDLVEEILVRIPATFLKRLRSTYKKWNTLFNDRKFTQNHFHKAEKEYLHLMLRNDTLFRMSVNLHGLQDNTDPSAIEFKGELSLKNFHNNSDDVSEFEVFHCNGFLLCTNKSTTVVWNPCTGQTKWILTKNANKWNHWYALGYVNKKSCHDYKILRFSTDEKFEVEIFEFNSDSWRVSGSVIPKFKLQVSGVSVKGNTYWIAYDNVDNSGFVISFDFTTDRFGPRMCLPFQGNCYAHWISSLYSVREERLSVLFQKSSKIEIWMTNDIIETNVMSWSKFLSIDVTARQFSHRVSFCIDEKNKFTVICNYVVIDATDNLLVHVIGEDRRGVVNLGDGPFCYLVPYLFSYAPSLLQI